MGIYNIIKKKKYLIELNKKLKNEEIEIKIIFNIKRIDITMIE